MARAYPQRLGHPVPQCTSTSHQKYTGHLHGARYAPLPRPIRADDYLCQLCPEPRRASHWDHCHDHGYVRGPLCASCHAYEGLATGFLGVKAGLAHLLECRGCASIELSRGIITRRWWASTCMVAGPAGAGVCVPVGRGAAGPVGGSGVRARIGWRYALSLDGPIRASAGPCSVSSVFGAFCVRWVEADAGQRIFDRVVESARWAGVLKALGRARIDPRMCWL
ncbi:endonuclease domain-containing protein [Streptomyces inhibens]|uniref:endonuclease domain-containing protein n=1 Tax=Streptomyces inhibens TaxID=2293571 RepID=UPI00402A7F11